MRVKPNDCPRVNKLESANEGVMCTCSVVLIFFRFSESSKYHTLIGWIYIALVVLYILINLLEVVKDLMQAIADVIKNKFLNKRD
jgi:FtsH-binding integral membrane protein